MGLRGNLAKPCITKSTFARFCGSRISGLFLTFIIPVLNNSNTVGFFDGSYISEIAVSNQLCIRCPYLDYRGGLAGEFCIGCLRGCKWYSCSHTVHRGGVKNSTKFKTPRFKLQYCIARIDLAVSFQTY